MSLVIEPEQVEEYVWRVPRRGPMRVEGLIVAGADLINAARGDQSLLQLSQVACLPGIVGPALAMPDFHSGYGFPIGGVAGFDAAEGVISPGGVGYDINCGVRLLRSGLERVEVSARIGDLVRQVYRDVPSGVGSRRKDLTFSGRALSRVLARGAAWMCEQGFGDAGHLDLVEENGALDGADPKAVSEKALSRGRAQLGTLGSGNHFIEIGYVEEVYDEGLATRFGLRRDLVTVMVHTGSRGLGHQVCTDYVALMLKAASRNRLDLPHRQLAAAPLASPEGRAYWGAMAAAANYAFANRQLITHFTSAAFEHVMGREAGRLGLIYDHCHNIAKMETHAIGGRKRKLCVHRKGATRSFGPGHPSIPSVYRDMGLPVIIPGDMGRYSYLVVGAQRAAELTLGSTGHGAGRRMSRAQALRQFRPDQSRDELRRMGVEAMAAGKRTLAEEMPGSYKDVSLVVQAAVGAGINRAVARLRPLGVVKG